MPQRRSASTSESKKNGDSDSKSGNKSSEVYAYSCNSCSRNITNEVRIKCAECEDVDMCLECFSIGREVFPHSSSHDYRIIDSLDFAIYDKDWRCDEEIALLDGIEERGFGNWRGVAEYVGTKTSVECKKHYEEMYLSQGAYRDMPDFDKSPRKTDFLAVNRPIRIPRHTHSMNLPDMSKAIAQPGKPLIVAERSETPMEEPKTPTPPSRSMPKINEGNGRNAIDNAGFMPKRGEFETEYDNLLENIVKELSFAKNGGDRQHKVMLLNAFRERLQERYKRRDFVVERGLYAKNKFLQLERKKNRIEKDFLVRMKRFARFTVQDEYDALVDGLLTESKLAEQIRMSQRYRSLGLTSVNMVKEFNKYDYLYADQSARKRQEEQDRILSGSYFDRRGRVVTDHQNDDKKYRPVPRNSGFNIKKCEGVALLSSREKDLCNKLKITPRQYFLVKSALVNVRMKGQAININKLRQLIDLDDSKIYRLHEHFSKYSYAIV